jgi:hypothetical protein
VRNALPLVGILLAVAAGLWLFLGGEEPSGPGPDFTTVEGAGAASDPRVLEADGTPELDASGRPRPAPPRPSPRAVDPRAVPRGSIVVRPVGADGASVPAGDLRVDVTPTGRKDWRTQVGRFDQDAGAWTFDDVLAGPVRVDVRGDLVLDATATATVKEDAPVEVEIPLRPGGAIRYDVSGSGEERPGKVTLSLLDGAERPVVAWYQVRTPRSMTQPQRVASVTQGPEGVIFGLAPGTYRLRVESEDGIHDEQDVEVVPGGTAAVSFALGR